MNANEIVKALRWMAKDTWFIFVAENLNDAADLIESLQAQLSASQRREKAAVEDMYQIEQSRICEVCVFRESDVSDIECRSCAGRNADVGGFVWRGPQEAGEGAEHERD